MKYNKFIYLYPPRPENAICPEELDSWDNSSMIGQIKTNGSNTLIFTNGSDVKIMGRHKQILSNIQISQREIIESLYNPLNLNGKWLVLNAECLNKNKLAEDNSSFNQKLILFDILVYNSDYLVGRTFKERINLLDNLYGRVDSEKEYLYKISKNIYRVKSYESGFSNLFNKFTPVDLVEGVVLKRANAKLEVAASKTNNSRSQVKCRKSSRNYKY